MYICIIGAYGILDYKTSGRLGEPNEYNIEYSSKMKSYRLTKYSFITIA